MLECVWQLAVFHNENKWNGLEISLIEVLLLQKCMIVHFVYSLVINVCYYYYYVSEQRKFWIYFLTLCVCIFWDEANWKHLQKRPQRKISLTLPYFPMSFDNLICWASPTMKSNTMQAKQNVFTIIIIKKLHVHISNEMQKPCYLWSFSRCLNSACKLEIKKTKISCSEIILRSGFVMWSQKSHLGYEAGWRIKTKRLKKHNEGMDWPNEEIRFVNVKISNLN